MAGLHLEMKEKSRISSAWTAKKRLQLTTRKPHEPETNSATAAVPNKINTRFKLVDSDKLAALAVYNPPSNTKTSTSWAIYNLHEWFRWQLTRRSRALPRRVFEMLCQMVAGICKLQKLGTKQVVSTHLKHSYCLLCGILHHMTTENPEYPNINFWKKSLNFVDFQFRARSDYTSWIGEWGRELISPRIPPSPTWQ